jgi:formylglycine-generating enzyme required for sulfatase activity
MRTLLFLLCTLFCSQGQAQLVQNTNNESVKIDKYPVSNQDWYHFIKFMKNDPAFSEKDVLAMTPHQWSPEKLDPKNKDRAVTGVSWQQATRYCQWKSELLTYLNTHIKPAAYQQMCKDNKLAVNHITYRLPSGAEYQSLVRPNATCATGGTGFRGVYLTHNKGMKYIDL